MTRDAELRARDFVALVSGGIQPRPRSAWRSGCCCRRRPRWVRTRTRSGPASQGWPALRRPAAGAGPRRGRQARTISWPSSTRCAHRCCRPAMSWCWPTLLDHDPADLGLPGLSIDTDLRWRIVTALAAAGDVDADGPETPFIDAEVQRDPTAAGKRHGAQAAAARPQLAVKEQAWSSGHRRRHAAQHHRPIDHRRFRRTRAGRAAEAVRRALFRGDPRHVGAPVQRGRRRRW